MVKSNIKTNGYNYGQYTVHKNVKLTELTNIYNYDYNSYYNKVYIGGVL